MKDVESWQPTKFISTSRGLRANRSYVAASSILAADFVASFFDRAIPEHARGSLLDLGCGTVPLWATYRGFVEETTCVDWPGSAHDSGHVDVFHDLSKLPLPLPAANFDTVILSDVLEHIPDPEQLLVEVARCSRPGARILISVPFLYRPHEVPHDYWRFTEWGLRRLIENAGMQVTELVAQGGPIAVGLDVFGKSLASLSEPAGRIAGAVQRGASRLIVAKSGRPTRSWLQADNMPLSYTVVAEAS